MRRAVSDEEAAPLEGVRILGEARTFLRRQLDMPGRLRGGLLFGARIGRDLHVETASGMGLPAWYPEPGLGVLEVDQRYVMGWSDCLEGLFGGRLDWVGNWLAFEDNRLPGVREDLRWLARGARLGLFDDGHPLVVLGWTDGSLEGRAYAFDLGEPQALSCEFGNRSRPAR